MGGGLSSLMGSADAMAMVFFQYAKDTVVKA
jgi:hypothetical protein